MTSKFLKVKCNDCQTEKVTFSHPGSDVTCQVCGAKLLEPQGGKGRLLGELVEALE